MQMRRQCTAVYRYALCRASIDALRTAIPSRRRGAAATHAICCGPLKPVCCRAQPRLHQRCHQRMHVPMTTGTCGAAAGETTLTLPRHALTAPASARDSQRHLDHVLHLIALQPTACRRDGASPLWPAHSGAKQLEGCRFATHGRCAHPQVEQTGLGTEHALRIGKRQRLARQREHHIHVLAGL